MTGRIFFEEVIRENLDIGRPSQVSLIFDRKITSRTPGRFRTRVITDGVVPSLHIDYKKSRFKQYHKLLEALRTETTINALRVRQNVDAGGLTSYSTRIVDLQRNLHIVDRILKGAKPADLPIEQPTTFELVVNP